MAKRFADVADDSTELPFSTRKKKWAREPIDIRT
jgi:hypothetical protein